MTASAVLLWLALRGAELSDVRHAVLDADPWLLLGAVCAMGVVYLLQAERWLRIARNERLALRWYLESIVSGIAVNNVLPGRLGDLLRARWLSVDGRMTGGRALSTVVVDRSFDVAALVGLLGIGVVVVAEASWLRGIVIGSLVLLVALAVLFAFARFYIRLHPRARHANRGRARRLVRDTLEGIAEPLTLGRIVALLSLSIAAWSTWAFGAWLVARSVGIELAPLDAAFVAAVLNLGVAIPSSPGFVGTYQWLAVSAFAVLGVSQEPALAFAILMQAAWYVPTTVAGVGLLARRGVRSIRGRRSSGLGEPSPVQLPPDR